MDEKNIKKMILAFLFIFFVPTIFGLIGLDLEIAGITLITIGIYHFCINIIDNIK